MKSMLGAAALAASVLLLVGASSAQAMEARIGGGIGPGPIVIDCTPYCAEWEFVVEACGSQIGGGVEWCAYWQCTEWVEPCEGEPT